jgi:hypothetical protein
MARSGQAVAVRAVVARMSNLTLDRPAVSRSTSVRTGSAALGSYTGTAAATGAYTGTASTVGSYAGRTPALAGSYVRSER